MVITFDREKLPALLKDFYEIAHIRIAIFDENMREIISFPPALAPYCSIIRRDPNGECACNRCDKDACIKADLTKRPYIYKCHAGLTEVIGPVIVEGVTVGFVFLAHIFDYENREEGIEKISNICSKFNIDIESLKDELKKATYYNQTFIESALHILNAIILYLISEKMANVKKEGLAIKLDNLITNNYLDPNFNFIDMCDELGIGRTQLYKIAQDLYGYGIAKRIKKLRIEHAQHLLQSTDMTITDIADKCGFNDYNYFIVVFKEETGTTPRKYRESV